MFLLKLALRPWRLAPFSQFFAATAVGFLLLLVGFLFWLQQGLKPVLHRLQGEQVITAYLEPALPSQEESQVADAIRVAVGAHPAPEVRVVDAKGFLGELRKQYPDFVRDLEGLVGTGPEAEAIVPRYVSVSGLFDGAALQRVQAVRGVESAESSKDHYHHIVGAFSALRWVARVLVAGLCLALITGLLHLSRMNSYLHRDALGLLRFWGAGVGTLRTPGTLSGLSVGLLGGMTALVGWATVGVWLTRQVAQLSPMLREMPAASGLQALVLLALGALLGLAAGVLGSTAESAGGA